MKNARKTEELPAPVALDAAVKELIDGRNFAVVATLNPDGGPQTSVVWVGRQRDAVVFSTTAGRQKARNLVRDPRISLTVYDRANPYRSVEIRGTAELLPDPDKALPRELSQRYLGEDPPAEPADVVRLIVRITAEKVIAISL
ncbi:PPOX class F420-dependent oxidoreductase [Streptomyces cinnamoneus]|uniref:PPOX class F420-dependent enzyme n=1 Tax=Streptomyces cinnamoneus TaxID=53446 RepID=A0A918WH11_STRCJ|nr:PPOX class F420-dependent oxidoreductase [Streptomyces cinnamoneus]GHC45872.1 PPOX class F420-dependent enzyme [Streptomyces cinnamoneus]